MEAQSGHSLRTPGYVGGSSAFGNTSSDERHGRRACAERASDCILDGGLLRMAGWNGRQGAERVFMEDGL